MRLLVSGIILLVTTLDLYLGKSASGLHIAAIVAGVLLALSVIMDFLWLDPPASRERAEDSREMRDPTDAA